jgi:segregation and condensation protein A
VQVEKERLPWWRWALDFALGGIRSGFGLFRRNGKVEIGTQTASEAVVAEPERKHVELSTESGLEPDSSFEQESSTGSKVAEVESNAEKSTVPENIPKSEGGFERENRQSEVEASAEKPLEVESRPEPENSLEPDIGPEPENISYEVESFGITTGADEVTKLEVAPILPVEASEDESPDLAPEKSAEEDIALTNSSPQSEESEIRRAREQAFAPKPAPPAKEPPAPDQTPPAKEPPDTVPAEEPPESEPAPPAKEPPVPAPPAKVASALESARAQEASSALPFDPPMAAEPPAAEQTTAEKVAAALKARGVDAEQSPFSVIVNQVYDGPLDLLLDLIRKQDIDIYDIPIAQITAQFLAYVDRLRASDMDVAGDFIYTAALLIHIKSKMLLPRAPVGPEESTEDPRRELVDRLLEHERFKNAAQMLHEKQMLEAATWTNPGVREFREDAGAEPEIAADTTDLVRIFRDILERARNRPILNVEEDSVTVGQMIQFLTRRLTMEDKPVALRRLLSHTHSERALIAMFLGLLELVRLQAILLRQDRQFSEIFVKKNTGFDAVVNEGLASAHDDWR